MQASEKHNDTTIAPSHRCTGILMIAPFQPITLRLCAEQILLSSLHEFSTVILNGEYVPVVACDSSYHAVNGGHRSSVLLTDICRSRPLPDCSLHPAVFLVQGGQGQLCCTATLHYSDQMGIERHWHSFLPGVCQAKRQTSERSLLVAIDSWTLRTLESNLSLLYLLPVNKRQVAFAPLDFISH